MAAPICPDCGEEITYRSCQQPNTEAVAALVLLVHRKVAHGAAEKITPAAVNAAFFESRDALAREEGPSHA